MQASAKKRLAWDENERALPAKFVILRSTATKNLSSCVTREILRYAQDDNAILYA